MADTPRLSTQTLEPDDQSHRWENFRRGLYRFRSNQLSMIGLGILIFIIIVVVFAPVIALYPEDAGGTTHVTERLLPPSLEHPFGTDKVGRDIYSRVVMGTGLALKVGTIIIVLAASIGVTVGAVSAYFGGWVDEILMRITDIFLTVPALVLAIAISAALGKGIDNAMVGNLARLVARFCAPYTWVGVVITRRTLC